VVERGDGRGLVDLGWVLVHLGRRGHLMFGLALEQGNESARDPATQLDFEGRFLLLLLFVRLLG
jgi:hypothetical protein